MDNDNINKPTGSGSTYTRARHGFFTEQPTVESSKAYIATWDRAIRPISRKRLILSRHPPVSLARIELSRLFPHRTVEKSHQTSYRTEDIQLTRTTVSPKKRLRAKPKFPRHIGTEICRTVHAISSRTLATQHNVGGGKYAYL